MATSKAIRYNAWGGYDVIEIITRPVRAPQADEVRIRVKAAAVNPADIAMRDPGRGSPPLIPGMDAAGMIDAVGPGVSRLRLGEEVMAVVIPRRADGGAQAAHIVVPAASVVPIPRGASLAEASTLPMNGLTACRALELADLKPGQVLAVSGGAGLLAHYAIAIANHLGIRVIADAKREETELVRSYGAHVVVERSDDFASAIRWEFPEGADALLDTALLNEKAFPAIKNGGVYLPVRGWHDGPRQRSIEVGEVWVREVIERTDMLELLRSLVESKAIRLRVAGEYPPERVADAQRALLAGGLRGRPVIVF